MNLNQNSDLSGDIEAIVRMFETADERAARLAKVSAFSDTIKKKKNGAITARKRSGIEDVWQVCEDGYEGADEYNQKAGAAYTKGRSTSDGLREVKKAPRGRSTVIPNITRQYVDAASARLSDMLIPTDDINWALEDSPVKDVVEQQRAGIRQDRPPGIMSRIGSSIAGVFGQQPQQPAQAPAQEKKAIEIASETINDWHAECRYHSEVRKVIESSARIGAGILKGPHPTKRRSRKAIQKDGRWGVEVEIKVSPASTYVSAWNFYPDYPACGNDIQRGSFVFERDDITAKALSDLRGGELGYIDEMIDMCLAEGPSPDNKEARREDYTPNDADLFEIWYYYGFVSKEDMEAAGCEGSKEYEPCIVTMVNDRVIKVTLSVLDTGEFPFDVMVWQARLDHWAGIGVAEQIATCQKSLTGAVRALQDNMALSSGPQMVVDTSKIEPADGKWTITPWKFWRKRVDSEEMGDVRQAITIISIETRQAELLNIINYWTREAETVTSLPMLLQGQMGGAPETFGGQQIVNNNGSTVLRRIARTFDDRITEPHIGRYYEYLMLHGPDEAKGDFVVKPRGSSALVERELQKRETMQLLGASLNPAYGVKPEKVMKEVLKGMRFDPDNFGYSEEEKQAMAQQQQPEDPRITAAKIMAESRIGVEQMQANEEAVRAEANAQMVLLRQQWESREKELDRQNELVIAAINERMQNTQLTSGERQNLDKIKATLAGKTAELRTQKELSMQAISPPTEPAGRAPDGQSWQK
jgi:hypothetical protein